MHSANRRAQGRIICTAFVLWFGLVACGGGGAQGSDGASSGAAAPCAPAPTSSLVANVKDVAYGAKGDGVSDDTAALQRAVDAVAGTGGTVYVPDGVYRVNAVASSGRGLILKSQMTLLLSSAAVLKALPNSATNYAVVIIPNASNVNVVGGTIEGERSLHTGTTGEWGHGLVVQNAQHVAIQGVTSKECWGDGFYISGSTDVIYCGVTADHNRRQGISITSVDGLVIRNSTFKNTAGTLPEDGLDIEPNSGETVNHVLITGCTFSGNAGYGMEAGVPLANTGVAQVLNVVIDSNAVLNNGLTSVSGNPRAGIEISNCAGQRVTSNTVTGNKGYGILLRSSANTCTVSGNMVSLTNGDGIYVGGCDGDILTGNTVTNNTGHGIFTVSCTNLTVSGNTVSGNGLTP